MPTPATFAPAKQFLGIAPEAIQGTPAAMTSTILVTEVKPSDKPTFLEDKAWRGSMGDDAFNLIPGVKTADIQVTGPVFGDTFPFWLKNILGDFSVTGTPTGSGATTLAAQANAGATSMSSTASIPAATLLQVGSGATAEIVTTGTPTGSGPYTIPIATPAGGLQFQHANSQPLTPVLAGGPFTYVTSLLNSGSGQPTSHTLTHFLGPNSTGARQYPGFVANELDLKFNVESELLSYDVKGVSWPSVIPGAAPVAAPGTTLPVASWRTTIGIGGTAIGSPVNTVTDGEINIKREATPIFTATGVQTPYIIQRGGLSVEGKLNFSAVSDESALLYMLNNTQPQIQIITTNGLSGAAAITVQVDMQVAAFNSADPDTSKTAVGYQNAFKALFNTTNAGGSGGMSPIKVSVTCAIPPGAF